MKTKIEKALEIISKAASIYGSGLFIGHSGGKDSQVIMHLTKQVTNQCMIVHNVKPLYDVDMDSTTKLTAMYPETLQFLYSEIASNNEVYFMPASMMLNFVHNNELTCQIDGARIVEAARAGKSANIIRNGESISRADMKEFEPNGIFNLAIAYPIYDWTDNDVFDYITMHNIPLSAEYEISGELAAYRNGDL